MYLVKGMLPRLRSQVIPTKKFIPNICHIILGGQET